MVVYLHNTVLVNQLGEAGEVYFPNDSSSFQYFAPSQTTQLMPLHYNMKTIVAATPSKAYSRMHFSAAFLEILLLIIIITIIIINFFLVGARV